MSQDGDKVYVLLPPDFPGRVASLAGKVHLGPDVIGLVPAVGEFADASNAVLYTAQGDWANAGLSLAGMIPFGGQAAGLSRIAQRFTPDQAALVNLVNDDIRRTGGLSSEQIDIVRKWAREVGLPFRGPEIHPGRRFGRTPHVHVGPVNHIQVIP
jgi:hypothetical protein